MTFPVLDCRMVPVVSDVGDIPDDLDMNYEEGCFYVRMPLAESDDGRWLTSIDVGYRETSAESPCAGVAPIDFVMFGYEITVFDQIDNLSYSTMDPLEARCVIPDEMSSLVVDIVCECYLKLIENCDANYIFRSTWLSKPCENAMKKHTKATEMITQAGYIVLKGPF
jgi:hypothetical protein